MRKQPSATNDKVGSAVAESFIESHVPHSHAAAPTPIEVEALHEHGFLTDTEAAVLKSLSPDPLYRWQIPGDKGYSLLVEVAEARNLEHARASALGIIILGEPVEGEEPTGRELTQMERGFILTTEPEILRDTTAITLTHWSAVQENERLKAENQQWEKAKAVFEAEGIDVHDPSRWLRVKRAEINEKQHQDQIEQARVKMALYDKLAAIQTDLSIAMTATGYAPPPPVTPIEPDYSTIAVIGTKEDKQRLPRLAGAKWVESDPKEPLTTEEAQAWSLLTNPDYGIIQLWRGGMFGSEEDALKVEKLMQRLTALVG